MAASIGVQFQRQYEGPLDISDVFSTSAERISFLENFVFYEGSICFDIETKKIYVGKRDLVDPSIANPAIVDIFYVELDVFGDPLGSPYYNYWEEFKSDVNLEELRYYNATPMSVAVGGVPSGTTFDENSTGIFPTATVEGATIKEIFDALFYPYQFPSFGNTILYQSNFTTAFTTVEVGTTLTEFYLKWTSTNQGNIVAGSIDITTPNEVFLGDVPVRAKSGQETLTLAVPLQRTVQTADTISIQGTNTKGSNFSKSNTLNWLYRVYAGVSAESDPNNLTETDIKNFTFINQLGGTSINTSWRGVKSFPTTTPTPYAYLAVPTSFGNLSFEGGLNDTAMGLHEASGSTSYISGLYTFFYTTIVITVLGVPTTYRVYRAAQAYNSSKDIKI